MTLYKGLSSDSRVVIYCSSLLIHSYTTLTHTIITLLPHYSYHSCLYCFLPSFSPYYSSIHGGLTFNSPSTNVHSAFISSLIHFLLQSLTTMSHDSRHSWANPLHLTLTPPSFLTFFFSRQWRLASLSSWKRTKIKYPCIFFGKNGCQLKSGALATAVYRIAKHRGTDSLILKKNMWQYWYDVVNLTLSFHHISKIWYVMKIKSAKGEVLHLLCEIHMTAVKSQGSHIVTRFWIM